MLGTDQQQKEFLTLFRDLVARGRAAAMPVIAATQRPSVDIIPKSLRDLFGYRAAFRCTSDGSSDIILGDGWSGKGFTATDIPPTNQGLCHLIAEGGTPRRVKVAYLTDDHIIGLAALAATHAPRRRRLTKPRPTATARPPAGSPHHERNCHDHTDPDARAGVHHRPVPARRLPRRERGHPGPEVRHDHPGAAAAPSRRTAAGRRHRHYVAAEYQWPVRDEDGCYETERDFGPVGYTSRPHQSPAGPGIRAQDSYWGSITPDAAVSDA